MESTLSRIMDERTAILTLDIPPANVLHTSVLNKLQAQIEKIEKDPAVKVVIITSRSEKFFVAGADIKELDAIDSEEGGREYSQRGQEVLNRIENSSKPYIAAVEGFCLGGGCELALACHLRIAGAEAQFALPEINLGLMPGFGGSQRLPRLIGEARALEMILTGKRISAQEAHGMGLTNQVVKKGAALDTALTLAKQIQSKSALSVAAILAAVQNRDCVSLAERFEKESREFGKLFPTEDKKEGISAFLEKRVADFKDR